jgi:FAD/FMN-containing dehydrogenase
VSEPNDSKPKHPPRSRRWFLSFGAIFVAAIWAAVWELCRYACAPASAPMGSCGPLTSKTAARDDLQWEQFGGSIDDWSGLSCTPIYGLVRVTRDEGVLRALSLARERNLPITASGQRHSMGGQAFSRRGVILDMRGLNRVQFHRDEGAVTAQAGATWADILETLDPQGWAVRAMQSYSIFTLGGSLSVNGHGISRDFGAIAETVRELRVLLANGTVVTASASQNADLFRHVLGGYGLFGIVLEATLDVTKNCLYQVELRTLRTGGFPEYCRQHLTDTTDIPMMYGRFSVAPGSGYMDDLVMHEFHSVATANETSLPPMNAAVNAKFLRFLLNISKTGSLGRWLRWHAENAAGCEVDHGRPLPGKGADCFVTRNTACDDSTSYLLDRLDDSNLLQEYFVPVEYLPTFMDGLRKIVQTTGANLINVTLRFVRRDTVTALSYAPRDMVALVLYCSEPRRPAEQAKLREATLRLIDLSIAGSGTFYLPYRLDYGMSQLRAAYPQIDDFFAAKRRYDPEERFTNHFYETYGHLS